MGLVACGGGEAAHPAVDGGYAPTDAEPALTPGADDEAEQARTALRTAYRDAARTYSLPPVEWRACPLVTLNESDAEGEGAACAEISVPLSWLAPHAATTRVFVKHIPSIDPPQKRVWLLTGGPGLASDLFEALAFNLHTLLPFHELYLMDYRGTGRSGRLTCPSDEDTSGDVKVRGLDPEAARMVVERCFDTVQSAMPEAGLQAFNTTETAMDLGMLAAALGDQGQDIRCPPGG